jgi:uncharacterized membrane protein
MERPPHPLHAVLLAGTVPLFVGALLSDLAYANSYQIQWKNFASWLLVGGLVFAGLTLLMAVIYAFRAAARTTRQVIYLVLLLVVWASGFIDELVHTGDAWASMPAALILSTLVAVLALATTWLGYANAYRRVTP